MYVNILVAQKKIKYYVQKMIRPTVSMVFLSITNIPSTLNPIGSPFIRLKNTFTYTYSRKQHQCFMRQYDKT